MMMIMERQDRAPIPVQTFIDLSQDNEEDDPTYSPVQVKKLTSPRKEASPSSRTKANFPIWKGQQPTLDAYFRSPTKQAKVQSTMDSFLTSKATPARTSRKQKEGTAQVTFTGDVQSLQGSASTATTPKRHNASQSVNRPLGYNTIVPPARDTPGVVPSNYNQLTTGIECDLFFPNRSQASTVVEERSPPCTSDWNRLLFPGGSSKKPPAASTVHVSGWESPAKRKFAEIMELPTAQQPDINQSRSSSPDPLQAPSSISTVRYARAGNGIKRTKSMQPALYSPSTSSHQDLTATMQAKATGKIESSTHVGSGTSGLQEDSKVLHSPCGNDAVAHKRTHDVSEEANLFEDYDPFEDVEEIRELRSKARSAMAGEIQGKPNQPPPKIESSSGHMDLGLSLAARLPPKSVRRPYLSQSARDFLRHMGRWDGFREYDGCLIHVDFTAMELETLKFHMERFTGLRPTAQCNDYQYVAYVVRHLLDSSEESLIGCMRNAARELNGRTSNDCVLFAKDCFYDRNYSNSNEYLQLKLDYRPPKHRSRQHLLLRHELGSGDDRASVNSEALRQLQHSIINNIAPWRVFKEGSSDILDIAWSPTGDAFALGAATLSDVYNRPGNLILGSVTSSKARMLHGHQQQRPEPVGAQDPILHSTVPGVGFSYNGLLFSGSYDATVKVWHPNSGALLSTRGMDDPVVSLSVSPYQSQSSIIAVGCKTGTLEISSWDENGAFLSAKECLLNKTTSDILYPSCLAWATSFFSHYLIAGYDTQGAQSSYGSLVIYDAYTGKQFLKVSPGVTRHFDLTYHPSGMFATACASRNQKAGVKSHIRVFNLSGTGAALKIEVDSPQLDVNRVTISPCGTYVTSSGTDGSTICWDMRWPADIMCKLQHDPTLMDRNESTNLEVDDTGVEVALWSNNSDYLYTGSSDGIIKIWDIKRGNPYVKDLVKVNAQIMSGAFSPGSDMLLVGDASGTATLLSTLGDKDVPPIQFETEGEVLPGMGLEDRTVREGSADIPESELGRYYGRELLRSGRVILGYGASGYGAYGLW
ncbi:WD40-repeat-containing domain protein [Kalaharituber pfeilii]|nr:WD40-repeat-containing domain protein [Kalaharituber pfeilii]